MDGSINGCMLYAVMNEVFHCIISAIDNIIVMMMSMMMMMTIPLIVSMHACMYVCYVCSTWSNGSRESPDGVAAQYDVPQLAVSR